MFIPEGNAKTFSMHLHRNIVYSLVVFMVIFIVGFILLVVKSGEIAAKLQLVYVLTNENRHLREDNQKIKSISEKIDRIELLGRYLRRVAQSSGVDPKKSTTTLDAARQNGETASSKSAVDKLLDSLKMTSSGAERQILKKGESAELSLAALPSIQPVVDGWITRRYIEVANDTEQMHNGLDYAATQGTLIRATAPGIVEDVCNDKYFGLLLTIRHGYGFSTRYGHCSQILVAKGDHVERGQTIALVGNTGRSSAPHLHYEIIKDGKNIDPAKFIFSNQGK